MTTQLDRIEWKLDQILGALMAKAYDASTDAEALASATKATLMESVLHKFTTKQHVALQMLMRGADNQEIADRMVVSINTAKVHVRGMFRKLNVNSRAQLIHRLHREFDEIDDNGYMMMTGGLPKDWDANFVEPDPFARLYAEKRNDTTTDAA
jgi:DNA-binding CsgD family transcriptional regulator